MRKVLLIMSHPLTEDQKKELGKVWGVTEFVSLPHEIRGIWSNIPPELETVSEHLRPIYEWMRLVGSREDLAFIQGDQGATFLVVEWARNLDLIPVYATTKREVKEKQLPDGRVVQERVFKHVRFRIYGK